MSEKKVSDLMISKGVDLWCEKLMNPSHDNGDESLRGVKAVVMMEMVVKSDIEKAGGITSVKQKIEVFRKDLMSKLIAKRDSRNGYSPHLSCDYHPCTDLSDSAEVAVIPASLFSVKSLVAIRSDRVIVSWGYGAPEVNYYPLSNGRWLLTSLTGREEAMEKIKRHVVDGNEMEFVIQD